DTHSELRPFFHPIAPRSQVLGYPSTSTNYYPLCLENLPARKRPSVNVPILRQSASDSHSGLLPRLPRLLRHPAQTPFPPFLAPPRRSGSPRSAQGSLEAPAKPRRFAAV